MDFRPISRLPKRTTWSHGRWGSNSPRWSLPAPRAAPAPNPSPPSSPGARRSPRRAAPELRPRARALLPGGARPLPAVPGRGRRLCRGHRPVLPGTAVPAPAQAGRRGAPGPGWGGRHRYSPGAMGDWSRVVPAPRGGPGSASCSGPLPPPQPPLSTNPPSLPSPPPEAPPSPSPETPARPERSVTGDQRGRGRSVTSQGRDATRRRR